MELCCCCCESHTQRAPSLAADQRTKYTTKLQLQEQQRDTHAATHDFDFKWALSSKGKVDTGSSVNIVHGERRRGVGERGSNSLNDFRRNTAMRNIVLEIGSFNDKTQTGHRTCGNMLHNTAC